MEESKELQQLYTLFRGTIYVLLLMEFLVFVSFPPIVNCDVHWIKINDALRRDGMQAQPLFMKGKNATRQSRRLAVSQGPSLSGYSP